MILRETLRDSLRVKFYSKRMASRDHNTLPVRNKIKQNANGGNKQMNIIVDEIAGSELWKSIVWVYGYICVCVGWKVVALTVTKRGLLRNHRPVCFDVYY